MITWQILTQLFDTVKAKDDSSVEHTDVDKMEFDKLKYTKDFTGSIDKTVLAMKGDKAIVTISSVKLYSKPKKSDSSKKDDSKKDDSKKDSSKDKKKGEEDDTDKASSSSGITADDLDVEKIITEPKKMITGDVTLSSISSVLDDKDVPSQADWDKMSDTQKKEFLESKVAFKEFKVDLSAAIEDENTLNVLEFLCVGADQKEFLVQSKVILAEEGGKYKFASGTAIYKQWWFYALIAIALVALLLVFVMCCKGD
ncbi:hypothetical protein ECANGB1_1915 [Enterospora canceri]|uniref:Uncharacterized protein n=1 Tax=Enterospora canceri TaxID=1081671 RepID=A0A1Y1S9R3_9MICR|nr:hypothetical protein ECANGB1_1915 [Enterospora canceri]